MISFVRKSDMNMALEWITESLQDVLDDRDEESSEGIPLVPLTDYSSAAMDSPSFQKLLRALGFAPPFDEQESYWRIPANMLISTIQKRRDLIEAALAGNFIVEGIISTFFFTYVPCSKWAFSIYIMGTESIDSFVLIKGGVKCNYLFQLLLTRIAKFLMLNNKAAVWRRIK